MADAPEGTGGRGPSLHQLLPLDRAGRLFAPSPDEAELSDLYLSDAEGPDGRWLRVNMVSTLDGAARGSNGLSGSISADADHRVFAVLRGIADAVLVGSGTITAERYTRLDVEPAHVTGRRLRGQSPVPPLVIASSAAHVDLDRLLSAGSSELILLVASDAPERRRAEIRERLGEDSLITVGQGRVDLARGLDALAERGFRRILGEGGPHLLASLAAGGLVDELDVTISPRLVGGDAIRIMNGAPLDLAARPHTLVSDGEALIGRWMVRSS